MAFVLFQGDDGRYRWRLEGGRSRVQAAGASAYKSFKTCRAKIDEFKELVDSAPVVTGEPVEAPARIRIVRDDAGSFRWVLEAATGRRIAESGAAFRRRSAVTQAVDGTREAAATASLTVPICPLYALTPTPAFWDGDVTLVVLPASVTDFGATRGGVRLLGAAAQSAPVAIREWTPGQIRLRLPASPPFAGPYLVAVDTAVIAGCSTPLTIMAPTACVFKITPQPAWWGDVLVLDAVASTTFGTLHGQVSIVGVDRLLQVHPLRLTSWEPSRIVVELPSSPPFPGPVYFVLVKSAQVVGEAALTVDSAHLVKALLDDARAGIRLDPAAPVKVGPGDKVAASLSALPSSVSVPGVPALPVRADVSWSVQTEAGAPVAATEWVRLGADPLAGSFMLAPGVVEAGTSQEADRRYVIVADVTLRAGGVSVSERLSVLVTVSALRVPTVLALFNHGEFDLSEHGGIPACALVLVPGGGLTPDTASILRPLSTLKQQLDALGEGFSTVTSVGQLAPAAGALFRLVELLTIMRDTSTGGETKSRKLIVRATNAEGLLHRIVFYREFLYTHSAEDTFGSAIFTGLPGRRARFHNAREFDTSEGTFELTMPSGALAVVVSSLHGNPPACEPDAVTMVRNPPSGSFGDRMSSLQFP